MTSFEVSEPHFLSWGLYDGREDKYIRATIISSSFNQLVQYSLAHSLKGTYHSAITSLVKGSYLVLFEIFDDAVFSKPSHRYSNGMINLRIDDLSAKIDSVSGQVSGIDGLLDIVESNIINTIDDGDGQAV